MRKAHTRAPGAVRAQGAAFGDGGWQRGAQRAWCPRFSTPCVAVPEGYGACGSPAARGEPIGPPHGSGGSLSARVRGRMALVEARHLISAIRFQQGKRDTPKASGV